MTDKRLLVVDDSRGIREFIGTVGEELGFAVATAGDHTEFRAAYRDFQPNFVVLDLAMPDGDGVELLRYLASERCQASVAVISGFDSRVLHSALQLGKSQGLNMVGTLQKPVSVPDLEALLSVAGDLDVRLGENDLREATEGDQLFVVYQPKAILASQPACDVAQAEALVRWRHPRHGVLPPAAFIPLAEESGLLDSLTRCVLSQVLGQIVAWEKDGLSLSVAVNIAPQLLTELDYPDEMFRLVRKHKVGSERLILEITESGAMEDTARAMDILTRFRVKGFELSIDDFGTGYSSLIQLYRMPFSELKIDKSFVLDVGNSEEAKTIIRASVDLAHNLGLKVCAEGVETKEALDFVTSVGCETAQGYDICRPVPPAEILEMLLSRKAVG